MFRYIFALVIAFSVLPAMGGHSDKPSNFMNPNTVSSKGWSAQTGSVSMPSGDIYSKLNGQIKEYSGTYGTSSDEGAVLLLVARNIYDNGGEFAWTQVQAANYRQRWYTWIDYYPPTLAADTIETIKLCNPGESCGSTEYGCSTMQDKLSDKLRKPGDGVSLKTSGETSDRLTQSMDVLFKENEENLSPTERTATHILLGVIELKEHGAIVAPITVVAQREKANGNEVYSWINSVTYDASQKKLLCKEGWVQSGEDCVQSQACEDFELQKNSCPGWNSTDYDPTKHRMLKNEGCKDGTENCGDENKCNLFVCSSDTQGFKSETDRECITCGETIKSGVKTKTKGKTKGKCEICVKGQYFNADTNACKNATEISTLQMKNGKNYETEDRKCWKYEDAETFANCVTENAQDWQKTLDAIKNNK